MAEEGDEKGLSSHTASVTRRKSSDANLHEYRETEGYVIDADDATRGDLKVARDGHTILIPQPSDDPNDPLNWSRFRKHLVLIIISMTAFLPDYGSATGAVTLLPQATIWHMR